MDIFVLQYTVRQSGHTPVSLLYSTVSQYNSWFYSTVLQYNSAHYVLRCTVHTWYCSKVLWSILEYSREYFLRIQYNVVLQ